MTVFYWQRSELMVKAAEPITSGLRIGFTVGRALGGAVQRNRMKRRLREAVRRTRPAAGPDADVVINPKKSVLNVDFINVVSEVRKAFEVVEQKLSGRTENKSPAGSKRKPEDQLRKPRA